MRVFGYLLTIGGLIATIFTVLNYINESETFSAFGLDVAVSKGNPTPIIISVIILIAGMLIIRASKK
jgi:hypothetical protein